jgi:hypothetical protein
MNKIPLASEFSFSKGLWLIFSDGDREIAAHSSTLGKESVFINGKLMSQKRTFRKISRHQFIFERNNYELVYFVSKILTGEMSCSLIKNDICIGKFKTHYSRRNRGISYLMEALLCLSIGSAAALFAHFFRIPPFFPLLTGLGIYLLIVSSMSKKGNKIVIEEIDIAIDGDS